MSRVQTCLKTLPWREKVGKANCILCLKISFPLTKLYNFSQTAKENLKKICFLTKRNGKKIVSRPFFHVFDHRFYRLCHFLTILLRLSEFFLSVKRCKSSLPVMLQQYPFQSNPLLSSLHPEELSLERHHILSKGCLPAPLL